MTACTLAGCLLALWLGNRPSSRARFAPAARGAWFATFVWCLGLLVLNGFTAQAAARSLDGALLPAVWAFVAGVSPRRPLLRVLAVAVVPIAALTATPGSLWQESVEWARGLPLAQAALGLGAALAGLALGEAMDKQRWLAFRLAAYWSSFVGSFALVLPLAVSQDLLAEPLLLLTPRLATLLAGLCTGLGLLLALAGTRGLLGAGGTPEPLDPTQRLCTEGVYAHLRHPLQLAEILFVHAGAFALDTAGAYTFCACFTLGLFGPLRLYEERQLSRKFGAAFEEWRARVPAYLPAKLYSRVASSAI